MPTNGQIAKPAPLGRGLVLALAVNLGVAICMIPVVNHWNARGGEEWSVGLVIGAAALTAALGTFALFFRRRRAWGVGLLIGAVIAPLTVGAVFIWYFALLNGS